MEGSQGLHEPHQLFLPFSFLEMGSPVGVLLSLRLLQASSRQHPLPFPQLFMTNSCLAARTGQSGPTALIVDLCEAQGSYSLFSARSNLLALCYANLVKESPQPVTDGVGRKPQQFPQILHFPPFQRWVQGVGGEGSLCPRQWSLPGHMLHQQSPGSQLLSCWDLGVSCRTFGGKYQG